MCFASGIAFDLPYPQLLRSPGWPRVLLSSLLGSVQKHALHMHSYKGCLLDVKAYHCACGDATTPLIFLLVTQPLLVPCSCNVWSDHKMKGKGSKAFVIFGRIVLLDLQNLSQPNVSNRFLRETAFNKWISTSTLKSSIWETRFQTRFQD